MKLKLLASATLATALISNAYAIEITKPVPSFMQITDATKIAANNNLPLTKTVYLMGLQLTAQDLQIIEGRQTTLQPNSDLPTSVQVGMGNTPVLDQGGHGSCATFAVTAAYDAILGKGDYVSQLCNLELGRSLEADGYLWNGWDGSWGNIVLAQLDSFGFVPKSHEKDKVCGGLDSYPLHGPNGVAMPESEFKKVSENLHPTYQTYFGYQPILTQRQFNDPTYKWDGNSLLNTVKQQLATSAARGGDRRVVFGVIIPYGKGCMTGACGTFHKTHDTWDIAHATTSQVLGGHEMVITGYDDDAVATDSDGLTHKGLLTLRNSWGSDVGDNGDFYMSYDFFTKYVLEAHAVVKGK